MILGCDAAGLDEDGNEVVVHAVIGDPTRAAATRPSTRGGRCSPSATRAPSPTGSCVPRAQRGAQAGLAVLRGGRVPADRLADGVPDAVHAGPASRPGDTVLVQGAGGGVATALITLGRAAGGLRVLATSRDEAKRGAGARARRPRGVRVRGPAAGTGRRGDGDGRARRPGRTRSARCGPAARS